MNQNRIAFQGELGANSHEACLATFPDMDPVPCATFEEAFEAVRSGDCRLGMIPVENSIAGRVADVHHLLPSSGLRIIGEHFGRIRCAVEPQGPRPRDGARPGNSSDPAKLPEQRQHENDADPCSSYGSQIACAGGTLRLGKGLCDRIVGHAGNLR